MCTLDTSTLEAVNSETVEVVGVLSSGCGIVLEESALGTELAKLDALF